MPPRVTVRHVEGKQLLGTARRHRVVTDRTLQEGGTDRGCTSGELLLLAIGSCGMGGLRRLFEERRWPCDGLSIDVFFEPHGDPRRRDRIVIAVNLDRMPHGADAEAIRRAALSGGVNSRIALGSELEVRVALPPAPRQANPIAKD
jgi:uncharacterized OsmC-like protein